MAAATLVAMQASIFRTPVVSIKIQVGLLEKRMHHSKGASMINLASYNDVSNITGFVTSYFHNVFISSVSFLTVAISDEYLENEST